MKRQRQYRLRGYGIAPKYVSTEPMRRHLAWLEAHGTGPMEAAALAGINPASVKYANDQGRTVREDIADAILAVTLDQSGRARNVATRRRIHGLMLLGYSLKTMADASGYTRSRLSLLMHTERVSPEVHKRIVAMTRALVAAGPSTEHYRRQNRARALNRGYTPLFDWDDLDDPTEKPKGVKAA